ncbi:hypothetical protein ACE1CC_05965 [Aerosakkonemataceae cyanobacterium BLCC-F46]|uniref:Uncharacterized protein n=1 Tax=Floridaenema aerugineum BLCC-F46 TaxID=3153654 RepID=A0ABV4X0X1_9CYAN
MPINSLSLYKISTASASSFSHQQKFPPQLSMIPILSLVLIS